MPQNVPAPGSLSLSDFAAKIRAQYPGYYTDKSDSVLVGAYLQKNPTYSQFLNPQARQLVDPDATPGNMQASPTAPVKNMRGITGPFAQLPGETPEDTIRRVTQQATAPGEQRDDLGNKVIIPMDGETFAGTLNRAIVHAKDITPQEIQQETSSALRKAPLALAAGPVMAGMQLAIPTAAAALTAPTAAGTSSVGTGLLDAAGNEITRDVAQYGPSMARAGLRATLELIKNHPYVSTAIGAKLASMLGIPVGKVLKALAGLGE